MNTIQKVKNQNTKDNVKTCPERSRTGQNWGKITSNKLKKLYISNIVRKTLYAYVPVWFSILFEKTKPILKWAI